MRKLMIIAASAAAMSLAACDGPREEAGEEMDNATGADGIFDEGPAEEYGEMMDDRADDLDDAAEIESDMEVMEEPMMEGETSPPVLTDDGMDEM